ncbi:response regulator transcription factor [Bradyrhizobium sp. UFLA05-112]
MARHVAPKLQKKSFLDLVRMAHTLDIIAVVCDERAVHQPILEMLISAGYVPDLFHSADEFVNSKRFISTSCLISDMQLPGASGLSLYERLVASGNAIPTILVLAGPDDDSRARALQAGVSRFLHKPFSNSELLACIKSALKDQTTLRSRA